MTSGRPKIVICKNCQFLQIASNFKTFTSARIYDHVSKALHQQ